ncbi:MAG TPA: KTSC domain-containing protein [Devosia sp.]|nr:KTSC domain-containing protein [Devosia sp.]
MPSTAIQKIEYDPGRRTLSVWFAPSGHRYDYFEVPPDLYRAFIGSGSKGRFFNTRIRDHFTYRRRAAA